MWQPRRDFFRNAGKVGLALGSGRGRPSGARSAEEGTVRDL